QAEDRLRLGDPALSHPFDGLLHRGGKDLQELALVERVADMRQIAREIELDVLVGVTDARVQRAEMPPHGGFVSALLPQLAFRGGERVLLVVDLAGRKLDEVAPQRIAELP